MKSLKILMGSVAMLALNASLAFANPLIDEEFWESEALSLTKVKEAVAAGHSIKDMDDDGYGPLFFAGEHGASVDIIEFLVAQGADINRLGHDARPPIYYITKGGSLEAVKAFLKHNPRLDILDETNRNLFAHATRKQTDLAVFDLLIEKGLDVKHLDSNGRSALHEAVQRTKSPKLIDYLIGLGLSLQAVDADGTNAFLLAAGRNSNFDTVKYVGAKLDAWTSTDANGHNAATRVGMRNKNVKTLEFLVSKGADPKIIGKKGDTGLIFAAYRNEAEIVERFLGYGVNVNHANNKGETALTRAAIRNKPEITKILLTAGSDVHATTKAGDTALIIAAARSRKGAEQIAAQLLEKGAKINHGNGKGQTALMAALMADQKITFITSLMDAGADIHAKDSDGYTPLMHAAINSSDANIVKLLLSKGADATIKDDFDETALDFAKGNKKLAGSDAVDALKAALK